MRAIRLTGLIIITYTILAFAQTMAAPGFYYEQAKWNGKTFESSGKIIYQCEVASWIRCTLQF